MICTAPAPDTSACYNCSYEPCPNLEPLDVFTFPYSERTSPPLYAVLPPVSACSARYDMAREGIVR